MWLFSWVFSTIGSRHARAALGARPGETGDAPRMRLGITASWVAVIPSSSQQLAPAMRVPHLGHVLVKQGTPRVCGSVWPHLGQRQTVVPPRPRPPAGRPPPLPLPPNPGNPITSISPRLRAALIIRHLPITYDNNIMSICKATFLRPRGYYRRRLSLNNVRAFRQPLRIVAHVVFVAKRWTVGGKHAGLSWEGGDNTPCKTAGFRSTY